MANLLANAELRAVAAMSPRLVSVEERQVGAGTEEVGKRARRQRAARPARCRVREPGCRYIRRKTRSKLEYWNRR
jgi:hypothetical protein